MMFNRKLVLALTAVSLMGMATNASATTIGTLILEVDVSDPDNVIFAATDGLADASAVTTSNMRLGGFLPNISPQVVVALTGDLGTADPPGNLAISVSAAEPDLFVSMPNGSTFTAGSQALTGSSAADISFYFLPIPGTVGPVTVNGTTVGEWKSIPEPSALALLGLGGLIVARRRAKHL